LFGGTSTGFFVLSEPKSLVLGGLFADKLLVFLLFSFYELDLQLAEDGVKLLHEKSKGRRGQANKRNPGGPWFNSRGLREKALPGENGNPSI
jgi:hypothetical protein